MLFERGKYVVISTLSIAFLIGGLLSYFLFGRNEIDSMQEVVRGFTCSEEGNQLDEVLEEYIYVDVGGAVVHPGIYKLRSDSLVADLINLSGGLSNEAAAMWAAKNLNLSKKLNDSEKVYIPFEWELAVKSEESYKPFEDISVTPSGTSGMPSVDPNDPKINVNLSSQDDLESLPGVGPVTAQRIINSRPYIDINDLKERAKLSQSLVDKITSLIIF